MPAEVEVWSGRLARPDVSWATAASAITVTHGRTATIGADDGPAPSAYAARFRQGAILVPRILLQVEKMADQPSPLGPGAGRAEIRSFKSPQAKEPWKRIEPLIGTIERRYLHPMLLGETVTPYRLLEPAWTVLPLTQDRIMTAAEIAEPEGLSKWWNQVEAMWKANRVASETLDLRERMDYLKQLSSQLPTAAHRVVYTASGGTLHAARASDARAVIEHKLYWAAVSSEAEARFLLAILNSKTLLERVRPLQSRGLFGPRDFDKHIFRVPIPVFDRESDQHAELADLAGQAEEFVAQVPIDGLNAADARKRVRHAVESHAVGAAIEECVTALLPQLE